MSINLKTLVGIAGMVECCDSDGCNRAVSSATASQFAQPAVAVVPTNANDVGNGVAFQQEIFPANVGFQIPTPASPGMEPKPQGEEHPGDGEVAFNTRYVHLRTK